MRCPYCGTPNDEAIERCRHCGHELPLNQGPWRGPDASAKTSAPPSVQSAHDEWDPARRHSEPRSMSRFVPPARYASYLGWSIAGLLLCFLAPTVIAYLLWNTTIAGLVLCLCPIGMISILFSIKVKMKHALADEARAFRYSQLAKFFCWISYVMGLAFYVGVFLRLMYGIGKLWGY
jgi:hypothetical protein